jgi:hypothetical protein
MTDQPRCKSSRDGECVWKDCPQLRDREPDATGRHCPLDTWDDEDRCGEHQPKPEDRSTT